MTYRVKVISLGRSFRIKVMMMIIQIVLFLLIKVVVQDKFDYKKASVHTTDSCSECSQLWQESLVRYNASDSQTGRPTWIMETPVVAGDTSSVLSRTPVQLTLSQSFTIGG